MRYTISYSGKVFDSGQPVREIFYSREFDENTPIEEAYGMVRDQVEKWIEEENAVAQRPREAVASRKPTTRPKPITIETVTAALPEDLEGLLIFEDAGEYIVVKPREFLGSHKFAEIASIIRDQLHGDYISAGKDSHFRVRKRTRKRA